MVARVIFAKLVQKFGSEMIWARILCKNVSCKDSKILGSYQYTTESLQGGGRSRSPFSDPLKGPCS